MRYANASGTLMELAWLVLLSKASAGAWMPYTKLKNNGLAKCQKGTTKWMSYKVTTTYFDNMINY